MTGRPGATIRPIFRDQIEKIGRERVEWLESQTQPKKWKRDYLMRFKRVMGKRLRRVEKAAKACA